MDITDTLAPTSDQLDAVDLLGGPRTFTIAKVSAHNVEQPINVHLVGFPRPWRPGKSMRRVLAAGWGTDAQIWAGHRVTLFCDTTVRFGGQEVGGTRISHMSHIDKPLAVPLLVTRGKSAIFRVQPLKDVLAAPPPHPEPTAEDVAACDDRDALGGMWRASGPEMRAVIEARVAAMSAPTAEPADTLPVDGESA